MSTPKDYKVNGEIAVWKELSGATAKTKTSSIREAMTADDVRVKLHTISMDDYIGFDILVKGTDIATNEDLALVRAQTEDALGLSTRKFNEKYLAFFNTSGNYTATTDTSALTSANAVEKLLAAVAEFKKANAAYSLVPKICYITYDLEAILVNALGAALRKSGTTEIGYKGYIGDAYGLSFLPTDLLGANIDFMIVGEQSTLVPSIDMGAPQVNPYVKGEFNSVEVMYKKPIGLAAIDAARVYCHVHAAA
jgi:hypothetical protein